MQNTIAHLYQSLNWHSIPQLTAYVIEQTIRLQQIPAPTFAEYNRAEYIHQQFEHCQLQDITIDAVYNVYGRLPGKNPQQPGIIISAHTDTVFPVETDLAWRREGDILYGPGMGDNCIGIGGVLGLLKYLRDAQITPQCDLWFVTPSQEEGLGDLGGMKAVFQTLKHRIGCVINIEGLDFGHICHGGIAVRRVHIVAQTEGGHSWLHFGRASATHAIVNLGARIISLHPPTTPRTTFNIGMLEGGQGINVVASQAGLWLDMRSEDSATLMVLERQVRTIVDELQTDKVRFSIEVVGDRPAGTIAADHPLVQASLLTLQQVGMPGILETGSTDANVPLASGCPAVTIGIARGGHAHRLDEFVDLRPLPDGLKQLIVLTLATAETAPGWPVQATG